MKLLQETLGWNFTSDATASLFIETTLRVSLLLMVTGCVVRLCRRASAAVRHRVWVLAIVGVLVIPGLFLAAPQLTLEFPAEAEMGRSGEAPSFTSQWLSTETIKHSAVAKTNAKSTNAIQPEAARSIVPTMAAIVNLSAEWSGASLLWIGWGAGAMIAGLLSLISLCSALYLVRRSVVLEDEPWLQLLSQFQEQLGVQRKVELRVCDRQISPMTWGFRRPVILLPQGHQAWTQECRRAVLLHELAHIQRHDWLLQMLTQGAQVVYWFHPLMWVASREVRKESDRAADDMALNAGMPATTYAEQLVSIAGQIAGEWLHPAPAMARRGQLSRRIRLLLDPRQNRRTMGQRLSALVTVGGICAVLLAAVVTVSLAEPQETTEKPTEKKVETQKSKPEETIRQQIERKLQSTIDVDFSDAALTDVAKYFGKQLEVNLIIDEAALNDEGISTDTPVSLHLKGVTAEFALRMLLEPLQLDTVINDEVLQFTTRIAAEELLETRVYDLGELLVVKDENVPSLNQLEMQSDALEKSILAFEQSLEDQNHPLLVAERKKLKKNNQAIANLERDLKIDRESLRKTIMACVAPDTWDAVGGPGVVAKSHEPAKATLDRGVAIPVPERSILPGLLVIRQTANVHQQIAAFLAELNQHCYPSPTNKEKPTTREKNRQAIQEALSQKTIIDFAETSLTEVVKILSQLNKINVVIDEAALNDEGISTDSTVSLHAEGISLKNVLRLALRPLQLQAVIDGEVLLITTPLKAEELQIVRIHDVSDLPLKGDVQLLKGVIESTVLPDTWKVSGGSGSISPLAIEWDRAEKPNPGFKRLLIVRQTEQGHEQVAALLEKLRQVRR